MLRKKYMARTVSLNSVLYPVVSQWSFNKVNRASEHFDKPLLSYSSQVPPRGEYEDVKYLGWYKKDHPILQ